MFSILMYHGIHADQHCGGNFDPVYSVTPERYCAQLDRIKEEGWRSRLLIDVVSTTSSERHVVVTFDDGDASNADPAVQPLLDRGMAGEFYVTSDRVGQKGSLTVAQLRDMTGAGMSVQSHGKTHRYLSDLADADIEDELRASKATLEDITGREVHTLALPGGRGDDRVVDAARKLGYRFICGSRLGANDHSSNRFDLRRVAVTRGMTNQQLASLMAARGGAYWKMRVRQGVLGALKTTLGNERYETFRGRFV